MAQKIYAGLTAGPEEERVQPTDTDDIGTTLPATTTLDTELLSPLSPNLQVRKTKPNIDIFTVRAELDQWERRNISTAERQL